MFGSLANLSVMSGGLVAQRVQNSYLMQRPEEWSTWQLDRALDDFKAIAIYWGPAGTTRTTGVYKGDPFNSPDRNEVRFGLNDAGQIQEVSVDVAAPAQAPTERSPVDNKVSENIIYAVNYRLGWRVPPPAAKGAKAQMSNKKPTILDASITPETAPLVSVQPPKASSSLPKAEVVALPDLASSTGDRPFMVSTEEFTPAAQEAKADIVQLSQAPNPQQAADMLTAERPSAKPQPFMTLDQLSQLAFTVYRHWSEDQQRDLIRELQRKQALGQRVQLPANVQVQKSRLNPWLIAGTGLVVLALAGTAIAVSRRRT